MTTRFAILTRPAPGVDWRQQTNHRKAGFGLAHVGLMLAAVTLIINWSSPATSVRGRRYRTCASRSA